MGLYESLEPENPNGFQRLPVEALDRWLALEYGMFIHYGNVTFNADRATLSVDDYAPPCDVDTDQWARVAKEAGMRYIILTTQHNNTIALWHTKVKGVPHVGISKHKQDVVASFVESCHKYGIQPAFYYSTSQWVPWYNEFVRGNAWGEWYALDPALEGTMALLDELLTQYGDVCEIWLDGSNKYGNKGRVDLYKFITERKPKIVVANNGYHHGGGGEPFFPTANAWPCDVITYEVHLPPFGQPDPWRKMTVDYNGQTTERRDMYIPVESCMLMTRGGWDWYYMPDMKLASDEDLLGMRLITRARKANLVLNVTPGPDTRIPENQVQALMRMQANMAKLS